MTTLYRVYFNRRGAPKGRIWCMDKGEGTRRNYFHSVGVLVPAYTKYSGKEPDWKNPVAWMTARGRLLVQPTAAGKVASILPSLKKEKP